ncbi:MAG: tRNA lysidine(34) synthetase TilS [Neisseria sp.]|uniref:tRNA lysidine(34) synthetase TilS n=1 Tax=Neisseria sp. TaxID=192066 RepID=UPI0026DC952A|nr:tRNA lysidine(34) synthetase TilS [Neisseria sp.]MDO4642185.1 tRNA lysidine(34) synthetase TilS [Neisseria sp.]
MPDLDTRLLSAVSASFERCIGQDEAVEVGLSGGLDSVVLLHLLCRLREKKPFKLNAVHVHHGLQTLADGWPEFCANICKTWQIVLRVEYVKPNIKKAGIEAGARKARYDVFAHSNSANVALAHHQDDQVETFMLAALRGGGLRSLAAMPEQRVLTESVRIWRPLLQFSRQDLVVYAYQHGLSYIDDPSNTDESLLRNWLRQRGLPDFRQRVPEFDKHIISSVDLLQQELAVLEEVAADDWHNIHHAGFFDSHIWRALSPGRQRLQLLRLTRQENLGTPTRASLNDFCRILYELGSKSAEWRLPEGMVYAYQNRLFGVRHNWLDDCTWLSGLCPSEINESALKKVLIAANFKLCRHLYGLREDILEHVGRVRQVDTDDVIELTVGHKKVRKLLQECKIPPFVRPYWPVITDQENRCIAVPNLWISPSYACVNGIFPCFEKFCCFVLEPK